ICSSSVSRDFFIYLLRKAKRSNPEAHAHNNSIGWIAAELTLLAMTIPNPPPNIIKQPARLCRAGC
ncbi:MAG: hypothetical protein K2N22_01710, partial [Clostridia bacterium]|nr:hypothetical protein [Clostridia bacterium]